MAYPDYTSTRAPDFVSALLRIPEQNNQMANLTARTQIDAQRQATNAWLAEVQRAKMQQEIEMAPEEQSRLNKLADSEIEFKKAQAAHFKAVEANVASRARYENLRDAIAAQQYAHQLEDRATQTDFNSDSLALSPEDWASEKGDELRAKYINKFHDPVGAATSFDIFARSNPTYGYALERKNFSPEAMSAYNDQGATFERTEGQRMQDARAVMAEQQAAREAAMKAKAAAEAISEKYQVEEQFKRASEADVKAVQSIVAADRRFNAMPQQQRSELFSKVLNEYMDAPQGKIDPKKLETIFDEVQHPKVEGIPFDPKTGVFMPTTPADVKKLSAAGHKGRKFKTPDGRTGTIP